MNELKVKDTITSLELLEQINFFRKRESDKNELQHKTLLSIIRDEFETEIGEQKILPTSYRDQWNREQPMYILTFNQAKQVLVRESKAVRKAVIHYIEQLEDKLKNPYQLPMNYTEAVEQLLNQLKENNKLVELAQIQEQKILENEPKVTYYDLVLQCKDLLTVTQIAKDYGMSAKTLNDLLCKEKIQHKLNNQWILYQKYAQLGLTKSKTYNYFAEKGEQHVTLHTCWTQKGRLFIYDLLKQKGILPIIDKENDITNLIEENTKVLNIEC